MGKVFGTKVCKVSKEKVVGWTSDLSEWTVPVLTVAQSGYKFKFSEF